MPGTFLRFVLVGTVGFVVDAGSTWLLVHSGFAPLLARIPSLLAAIVVTWVLNRTLTFRMTKTKSHREFARYAAVALSSALFNFIIYSGLVLVGIPVFPAVAIATGVLMIYSFLAYRSVVFR